MSKSICSKGLSRLEALAADTETDDFSDRFSLIEQRNARNLPITEAPAANLHSRVQALIRLGARGLQRPDLRCGRPRRRTRSVPGHRPS